MSSVLKALRDQSSPLLQQPAPIWLSSAPSRKPMRWWWLVLVVPAVLAVSGYWSWRYHQQPLTQAKPIVTTVTTPAVSYQLGASAPIKVPQWPTDPMTQPMVQQPQAQTPRPQPQPQTGVDLQQVSPELLAAFEQAVAAQQGGQPSAPVQSVLPAITALSVDMQRQIPSFSYDSHQYSSRETARSVTFSGQRLVEGDIWQGLTIIQITPTHVVLSRNMNAFQQPALEDWTRPL